MRTILLLTMSLAFGFVNAQSIQLDQAQSTLGSDFGTCQLRAQTFKAGLSGTLVKVRLHLWESSDTNATVKIIDGSSPLGTVIDSEVVTIPTTNTWVDVNFTTPATIVAGNDYTIEFDPIVPPCFYTSILSGDPYSLGDSWQYDTNWGWTSDKTADYPFETYVSVPTAVSENSTRSPLMHIEYYAGIVKVNIDGASIADNLVIFDALGRKIQQFAISENKGQVSIAGLSQGLYVIALLNQSGSVTMREKIIR